MNRRAFSKNLALGLLAIPLGRRREKGSFGLSPNAIRPPGLKKGDTIGLITPGSYISDEGLEKAVRNIEELGFRVKPGRHLRRQYGFLAGTDEQRLQDLHDMYEDKQVQGIWCARGGYGCTRLLPLLNFKLIKKHPKALIGYSDITALLNAIYRKTGIIGFHGPVASSEMTDYNRRQLLPLLFGKLHAMDISPFRETFAERPTKENSWQTLLPGQATGRLVGGNLTLLTALAGTPWSPDYRNKIVFLEEVGEKPYRIDRMMTQLKQATNISKAAGFALGTFANCDPDEDDLSLSLMETLSKQLLSLNKPVVYGLSIGHIKNQATLPLGATARLNAETGQIHVLHA